jgi:2,5-diamino-6-(ribosylamino)-4(3H)-pyrimidinone 5'-phosphate reductase
MSADGKISTRERRQVKISGAADFLRVDRLRAASDGVMVGIGTVLADDPSLTVKSDELKRERKAKGRNEHPIRVIVDSNAKIPPTASVLTKGEGTRVIGVSRQADPAKVAELRKMATVVISGDREVDLAQLLCELGAMGVQNLMVEGGGNLIAGLFSANLVDEIYTFVGNIIIGGRDAPTPVDGSGFFEDTEFTRLTLHEFFLTDDGILLHWKVRPGS